MYSHPGKYREIFLANSLCIGLVPGDNAYLPTPTSMPQGILKVWGDGSQYLVFSRMGIPNLLLGVRVGLWGRAAGLTLIECDCKDLHWRACTGAFGLLPHEGGCFMCHCHCISLSWLVDPAFYCHDSKATIGLLVLLPLAVGHSRSHRWQQQPTSFGKSSFPFSPLPPI